MDTIQERHFITHAGNENTFHKINEIAEKKEIKKKIEEKEKDEEVACASETKIEEKDEEVYNENVWWFGV